jgi:hypothetical protein
MMTQFVHTITAIIAFFQKRCNCFCEFSEYFPSNGNIFPHLLDFAQIDEKIIVYFSGNLCYTVRAGAGKGRPGLMKIHTLQAFFPRGRRYRALPSGITCLFFMRIFMRRLRKEYLFG